MAKDVSIAFKASDNLTHSLQKMRKSVDGLSRDVTEYRKIQSQAFDKKVEVNGTENFYITDNADLVIVYPPYAVAPYAAGTIEFIIPVSQVADIFNFKLE